MSDEEDRSGEAAVGRIPDEIMKVAGKSEAIFFAAAARMASSN
jgi:hypothetical protein